MVVALRFSAGEPTLVAILATLVPLTTIVAVAPVELMTI